MDFDDVVRKLATCDEKQRARELLACLNGRHKDAINAALEAAGRTVGVKLGGGENHPRILMLKELLAEY